MTEYIEREPLLKVVKLLQGKIFGAPLIVQAIEDAPAADVVEVVRCKDCKYLKDGTYCYLTLNYQIVRPEHFCSYGKIKE